VFGQAARCRRDSAAGQHAKRAGSGFVISAAKRRKRRKKRGVNSQRLADEQVAQILGYLRSSRVEHGLPISFGVAKSEIKNYALSRLGEGSHPDGLAGGRLFLFASLAPFGGLFHRGF
jgi:hypothetical protein